MQTHVLKTWPEFFGDIYDGKKTFELRRDDRGYRVGDELHLKEWDPRRGCFTGNAFVVKVKHIVRDAPQFGLEPGFCIMSITPPLR